MNCINTFLKSSRIHRFHRLDYFADSLMKFLIEPSEFLTNQKICTGYVSIIRWYLLYQTVLINDPSETTNGCCHLFGENVVDLCWNKKQTRKFWRHENVLLDVALATRVKRVDVRRSIGGARRIAFVATFIRNVRISSSMFEAMPVLYFYRDISFRYKHFA